MTEQKSDAELLPCPFCGDTMENHLGLVRHKENRPCVISAMGVDESAIPAWNHRSSPAGEIIRGEDRIFGLGDRLKKVRGSSWHGRVVGFYSTSMTPIGYVIESEREPGSCQLYPEAALSSNKEGSNNG